MRIQKKIIFVIIALAIAALLPFGILMATSSTGLGSLLSLNRAGTGDSWAAVGREGVGDSRLIIDWWLLVYPLPPSNFVASQLDITTVGLTWDMGYLANNTTIRISDLRYPTSLTEGYAAFSGNGTSCNITGLILGESNTYYFSAWSENDVGCSLTYATAQIGGAGMEFLAFIALPLVLLGLFFWKKSAFLAFLAAGGWILLGFYSFGLSNSSVFPITDIYMGLFWLCVGATIGCVLLPSAMREKPSPDDIYPEEVDEVTGEPIKREKPSSKEEPQPTRRRLSRFAKFGR